MLVLVLNGENKECCCKIIFYSHSFYIHFFKINKYTVVTEILSFTLKNTKISHLKTFFFKEILNGPKLSTCSESSFKKT